MKGLVPKIGSRKKVQHGKLLQSSFRTYRKVCACSKGIPSVLLYIEKKRKNIVVLAGSVNLGENRDQKVINRIMIRNSCKPLPADNTEFPSQAADLGTGNKKPYDEKKPVHILNRRSFHRNDSLNRKMQVVKTVVQIPQTVGKQ
jgi:hypothetical protein